MDDIKKQLFVSFTRERLKSIRPSNKVLCIVDDVYSELIGVPTDVPFNVLNENINQDETEYTIDISLLGFDKKSVDVLESKVELYYSAQDVSHNVEDFFEPYVDIQDVEDIYSLYNELDQVDEEDEEDEEEFNSLVSKFFQDEEDYDYDSDDDFEEDEDNEKVNQVLKNL